MISIEESLLQANEMLGRSKGLMSISEENLIEWVSNGCDKLQFMGLHSYLMEYTRKAIERNVNEQ